jgi:hypothetical protein
MNEDEFLMSSSASRLLLFLCTGVLLWWKAAEKFVYLLHL